MLNQQSEEVTELVRRMREQFASLMECHADQLRAIEEVYCKERADLSQVRELVHQGFTILFSGQSTRDRSAIATTTCDGTEDHGSQATA